MRVLGSLSVPHASIRACRLDPLPEIRTTRLCCESDMLQGTETMDLIECNSWNELLGYLELTRLAFRYRKFWNVG
jgi:hypothetical protein